ncbi:MAG: PAS domain S-box protein [Methanomicrobiaceae archaeon]|nr:PAS domain S-box protein [Methanomicrobiaceae archaeon]
MRKYLLINCAIAFSTLIVLLISFEMLSAGISAVFPHFYYLPILIVAYFYPDRGIAFSVIISLLYIIPVIFFFPGDFLSLFSALVRVFMFILVAIIVSRLVIRNRNKIEENIDLIEFQNKIIENPNVMVTASDREGRVVIWNRGAENITGYLRDDVIGRSDIWKKIVPEGETAEKIQSKIAGINSNSGSVEGIPIPLYRKTGDVRYLLVSLQGLNTEAGDSPGILTIAVDITEKMALESENRKALAQIEKNISQMYVLNDEIRNPLAVILGQAELDGSSSRDIICEQVIRINDIITQLDRDSTESTKIFEYLRKHYDFFK